jgi:molybdopterin-guanine dinucleotide biosynthesis protein B
MKIIGIVGRSQSGKTSLIKRLIPELKKRGLSVAAVKHCPHGFDLDVEGKDSWEFMAAGSDGVGLVAPDRVAVIKRGNDGEGLTAPAARYFPEADIVLVEGGPGIAGLKKIEVVGTGKRPATPRGELLALVSEQKPAGATPRFRPGDIAEIADFLEKQVRQAESVIRIEVDGQDLPLNHFVRIISENVVLGIVRSLKGGEHRPRSVVISLLSASETDKKS